MTLEDRSIETKYFESIGTIVSPEIAGLDFGVDSEDPRTTMVKDYMFRYGEDTSHISDYVIDLFKLDCNVSDKDMADLRAHIQSMERSAELIRQVMQQRREER